MPIAPAASCAKTKSTRAKSPQVRSGKSGFPRANGFNGFLRALPGDRAFLPPSSARWMSIFANLTPASGRQNHTTSPSARCAFVSCAARVHRIPRPTFVTIAKRPSWGHGTGQSVKLFLPNREAKNFSLLGWTIRKSRHAKTLICPLGKSVFVS
jgi:hypothetical protein